MNTTNVTGGGIVDASEIRINNNAVIDSSGLVVSNLNLNTLADHPCADGEFLAYDTTASDWDCATIPPPLTESQVEDFITNGTIDLDGATTVAGRPLDDTYIASGTVAAWGSIDVDHGMAPGQDLHVAVWMMDGSTYKRLPQLAANPAHHFGRGIDGDITVDGTTEYIEDLIPGYNGDTRVAEVRSLSLINGGILTSRDFDGTAGGRVIVRSQGDISICGTCSINVDGRGHKGGLIFPINSKIRGVEGFGEGAGTGGRIGNSCGHGGGGGGGSYGTSGAAGTPDLDRCNGGLWEGYPGRVYGDETISAWPLPVGSGGGSGSEGHNVLGNAREPGAGGAGGGAIGLWAPVITNLGTISANGIIGTPNTWDVSNPQVGSGGSGSGGSIRLHGAVSPGTLTAVGGPTGPTQSWGSSNNQNNGQRGGAGGDGRIYIHQDGSLTTGASTPTAITYAGTVDQFEMSKAFAYEVELVDDDTVRVTTQAAMATDLKVIVTIR